MSWTCRSHDKLGSKSHNIFWGLEFLIFKNALTLSIKYYINNVAYCISYCFSSVWWWIFLHVIYINMFTYCILDKIYITSSSAPWVSSAAPPPRLRPLPPPWPHHQPGERFALQDHKLSCSVQWPRGAFPPFHEDLSTGLVSRSRLGWPPSLGHSRPPFCSEGWFWFLRRWGCVRSSSVPPWVVPGLRQGSSWCLPGED